MCLVTSWSKPKKLKKDLIVWKVFLSNLYDETLVSPYQRYPYEVNKFIEVPLELRPYRNIVRYGIHSFSSKEDAEYERGNWYGLENMQPVIKKCIIRKGSLYYEGHFSTYNSIVSNSIFITNNEE